MRYIIGGTLFSIFLAFSPALILAQTSLDRSIESLAKKLIKKLPSQQAVLIADFENLEGEITELGRYMAERLHISVANISDIQIVTRDAHHELFSERKMAEAGILSKKDVGAFEKQVGAQTVVKGVFTPFAKKLELNLEIIQIEEGILMGGVRQKIRRTKDVDDMFSAHYKMSNERRAQVGSAYDFVRSYIASMSHVLKNRKAVQDIDTQSDLEFFYDLNFTYKTMVQNYSLAIGEIVRFRHHERVPIQRTTDKMITALENLKEVSERYLEILNGYFQYQGEIESSTEYQGQLVRAMSSLEALSQDYWRALMDSSHMLTDVLIQPSQEEMDAPQTFISAQQKEILLSLIAKQVPDATDEPTQIEAVPAAAIANIRETLRKLPVKA